MRVSLPLTLLFCLISFAAGAAGMYALNNGQEVRPAARRDQCQTADATDTPSVKVGTPSREAPAADGAASPADTGAAHAKSDAEPRGEPAATARPEVPAEVNPAPAAPAVPAEKTPAERAKGLRDALEKIKDKSPEELDPEEILSDMMGKRVDYSVTLAGTVTDSLGNPVAGAEVMAETQETMGGEGAMMVFSTASSGHRIAVTDASGAFSGTLTTKVTENAKVSVQLRSRAKGHGESKKVTVEVKHGETKDGIALRLLGAGIVTGRVVDATGQGVAGCTVSLTSLAREGGPMFIENEVEVGAGGRNRALTDASGEYRLEDVAEGSYRLSLRSPGYKEKSGPRSVEVKAGQIVRVDNDFVVAATTSLKVKLVTEGGQPAQGWATVEFENSEGKIVERRQGMVSAEGDLQLNDPPVGGFNVTVKLWGYHDSAKTWHTFTQDQPTDMGTLALTANPEATRSRARMRR